MADPEDEIARRFTDDPGVLAAAEKQAREQGWHQGPNQTVLGSGPVPWWLRKPATVEEITAFNAEEQDGIEEKGPAESPSTR